MPSNHDSRYEFPAPKTMRDAKTRKRALERDIMNIERQLADRDRRDRKGRPLTREAYLRWNKNARSSLIFKKTEHHYLKDWIVERRRAVSSKRAGIFDPNSPEELLLHAKGKLRDVLNGKSPDEAGLGSLYDLIDQYLHHAA